MSTYRPADPAARVQVAVAETVQRKAQRKSLRKQLAAARRIGLARRHHMKEGLMAEKAKRDPFEPWLNGFSYDQAFDGNSWTLTKGEDFDQSPSTVAGKLRAEFERRYGSLDLKVEGEQIHVRHTVPHR